MQLSFVPRLFLKDMACTELRAKQGSVAAHQRF